MKNVFLDQKIKDHLLGRLISDIIELDEGIYIYTKESLKERFGGPPIYINKKTGECRQLYTADLINGHFELSMYFQKKLKS